MENEPAVENLRVALLRDRNRDGGWGYLRSKESRLEPTALAMLAFAAAGAEVSADVLPGSMTLLARWQRADGLLACGGSTEPNLAFNGQAALAISAATTLGLVPDSGGPSLARLLRAILGVRGSRLPLWAQLTEWLAPSRKVAAQNNELTAWPWTAGTFSWVEPTAGAPWL
ncbi:MAG: hypothetical protein ACE148_16235 [Vicinamibacterales bacterium]